MKTAHCVFDMGYRIKCKVMSIKTGTLTYHDYDGPRQIACMHPIGCTKCGWNPEVEEKRKEKLWKK